MRELHVRLQAPQQYTTPAGLLLLAYKDSENTCPDGLGKNPVMAKCHAYRDLSVDGARIPAMRLRQIARGGGQSKSVHGDGGRFANSRFYRPSGEYKSDRECSRGRY